MFKTGGDSGSPAVTVERVAAFNVYAEELGVRVCVDANQGWTLQEALEFAESIQPYRACLAFLEQPIKKESTQEEWMQLRDRLDGVLISADESVVTADDALAASEWAGVLSLKVSKMGGITRTMGVVRTAEGTSEHPQFQVNSMLESGITQAAMLAVASCISSLYDFPGAEGVWGHSFMSCLRFADDVTDFALLVDSETGVVRLPEDPGLGVNIVKEKLVKYTLSKTEHAM
eukprot:TRINITY_DN527_c0_g1_i1.p1 TRINITY_DN527_c0_g1~~TRINITY_DN527_c0_g1_i1.p1  ORF type:complete len:231 (+),score=68.27 TRINITY_DN527_c0_g1_i1:206-898(+)